MRLSHIHTINWNELPGFIRATVWSANAVPPDFDYEFSVKMIDVAPLHTLLSKKDDSSYSEYESAGVYPDELDHVDPSHPIIIDRRLPHIVADGLHRVMRAALENKTKISSIDVTPMFIKLKMPNAANDYPPIVGNQHFSHDEYGE